jgi:hypothetical protein
VDAGVNKPFKGYIKNEFDDWLVTNSGKKNKPTRQTVCNWVKRAYDSVSTSTLISSCCRATDLKTSADMREDEEDDEVMRDDDSGEDDFLILSLFLVDEGSE